jgi:hypothetical protein
MEYRRRILPRTHLLFVLMFLAIPAAAVADSAGRVLYTTHCASCHGVDGRGEGPVARSLVKRPPDLTKLTKRFGMPISRSKLAEFIDGRADVIAHGPRDMPVWGKQFKQEVGPGLPATEDTMRRAIDVIVDYLITIQAIQGAAWTPSRSHGVALDAPGSVKEP